MQRTITGRTWFSGYMRHHMECRQAISTGTGRSSFYQRKPDNPWLKRMPQLVQKLICLNQVVYLDLDTQTLSLTPQVWVVVKVLIQGQLHGGSSNTHLSSSRMNACCVSSCCPWLCSLHCDCPFFTVFTMFTDRWAMIIMLTFWYVAWIIMIHVTHFQYSDGFQSVMSGNFFELQLWSLAVH